MIEFPKEIPSRQEEGRVNGEVNPEYRWRAGSQQVKDQAQENEAAIH